LVSAIIHFLYGDICLTADLYQPVNSLDDLKGKVMKYAGLVLMPAGFVLSIAAILLFPASPMRAVFVLCGLAVEAMGLVVAVRGHMQIRGENR
jgi:hypothetical protein